MRTDRFDYSLPEELIAQTPTERRDESRLLVFDRGSGQIAHSRFSKLPDFLRVGDVLVFNDTKVIAARLRGEREDSRGQAELLLLRAIGQNEWWTMLKPGRRLRVGSVIRLHRNKGGRSDFSAKVVEKNEAGHGLIHFSGPGDILDALPMLGEMPLPPYIRPDVKRTKLDHDRYQTVYARQPGSVAAPTAGLHFTGDLLNELREREIETQFVTLHVGLGTFAPVKSELVEDHVMHEEQFEISPDSATAIAAAKDAGRRIIAVGTTSVRVLESVAEQNGGSIVAGTGATSIFIYPPRKFRMVDALITNFHLPNSTLLMLVSAFASPGSTAGIDQILAAYQEAICERYRFFSYGDGMFIH